MRLLIWFVKYKWLFCLIHKWKRTFATKWKQIHSVCVCVVESSNSSTRRPLSLTRFVPCFDPKPKLLRFWWSKNVFALRDRFGLTSASASVGLLCFFSLNTKYTQPTENSLRQIHNGFDESVCLKDFFKISLVTGHKLATIRLFFSLIDQTKNHTGKFDLWSQIKHDCVWLSKVHPKGWNTM